LSFILSVLKHEHVSSDFYTIWTRVLHDQCYGAVLFPNSYDNFMAVALLPLDC